MVAGSSGGPRAVAISGAMRPSGRPSSTVGRLSWRDVRSGWFKTRKAALATLDELRANCELPHEGPHQLGAHRLNGWYSYRCHCGHSRPRWGVLPWNSEQLCPSVIRTPLQPGQYVAAGSGGMAALWDASQRSATVYFWNIRVTSSAGVPDRACHWSDERTRKRSAE